MLKLPISSPANTAFVSRKMLSRSHSAFSPIVNFACTDERVLEKETRWWVAARQFCGQNTHTKEKEVPANCVRIRIRNSIQVWAQPNRKTKADKETKRKPIKAMMIPWQKKRNKKENAWRKEQLHADKHPRHAGAATCAHTQNSHSCPQMQPLLCGRASLTWRAQVLNTSRR